MSAILEYLEYVKNQFAGIGIVDIIDILIVTILFYWVIKFVSGRRAGKLLVGLIFIVALLGVSVFLNMRALNFLLTNLFSVGIVAIVIVFQPELRSALEKLGVESLNLKNLKGKLDSDENSQMRNVISEICVAAEEFSRSKTGALIVFERTSRLGDVIRTGTTVDALPSSFLVGNIFYNKAPLHDGAMIIRNGRIHAAGCFLPLSENNEIIKELGTRHRAAIGMSENSDAVVLVVSEENGKISVAIDGNLKRDFTRKSLEKFLCTQLIKEEKKNKTNKGYFDNIKGKIFKINNQEGNDGSGKE